MNRNWKELYGNYTQLGVSLRSVNGDASAQPSSAIESGAVHFFMNLSGRFLLFGGVYRISMVPKTLAAGLICEDDHVMANFIPGEDLNELVILCVSPEWIGTHFGRKKHALHSSLKALIDSTSKSSVEVNQVMAMSYNDYDIASSFLNPPVPRDAQPFWYLAKIIELLSFKLFKTPHTNVNELFCSSQKRIAKERVDKVLIWLNENLDQPLNLTDLAKSVSCSGSYISRIFSESTGMTISQKLRSIRIKQATILLQDGDYNVTEVALEVGYNSLSHFTKAFKEEHGLTPSQFLKQTKT